MWFHLANFLLQHVPCPKSQVVQTVLPTFCNFSVFWLFPISSNILINKGIRFELMWLGLNQVSKTILENVTCNLQSLNLKTIRRFIKIITYSEALRVCRGSKAFSVMAWDWGQNRSLHFVSCVFSVWSNKRCRRLTKLQVNTKIK